MAREIKVRKATKKDAKEILKLELALIKYGRKFGDIDIKKEHKRAKKEYKKQFKKERRNWFILIAEDKKQIIGFNKVYVEQCYRKKDKYMGLMGNVFVKKKYRRKGVSGKLINEAINILMKRKIRIFQIYSNKANKKAISRWKKLGFKEKFIGFEKRI